LVVDFDTFQNHLLCHGRKDDSPQRHPVTKKYKGFVLVHRSLNTEFLIKEAMKS
jgi:hypothetical protein